MVLHAVVIGDDDGEKEVSIRVCEPFLRRQRQWRSTLSIGMRNVTPILDN